MSSSTVRDTVLDIFQKSSTFNTEFAKALTGKASSIGTTISGDVDTLFTSELKIDDYVGNIAKGYRRITAITDDTETEVDKAFDSVLDAESIYKIDIKKGIAKVEHISEVGRILGIAFISSSDLSLEASRRQGLAGTGQRVNTIYGLLITISFLEPNYILADERKTGYDKMIRDLIDDNLTLNNTCVGITEMGQLNFFEQVDMQGAYFGTMPLICYESQVVRGNR